MSFNPQEAASCRRLVQLALEEDLGENGDITSKCLLKPDVCGQAAFRCQDYGVIAGLPAVAMVFAAFDHSLIIAPHVKEGAQASAGTIIATVQGPVRSILASERTALNFLQRLSGIASLTRRYVDAIGSSGCAILDTRKTTPGWRLLEKYAVRWGGGHNHRMGLFDGVLIKDNHLNALGHNWHAVALAVSKIRIEFGSEVPVTIEVDRLEQLEAAMECKPNVVLLDNMPPAALEEAVVLRNAKGRGILLEASGGIKCATVKEVAATGVDRISVGEITHSAPALDISLDYEIP